MPATAAPPRRRGRPPLQPTPNEIAFEQAIQQAHNKLIDPSTPVDADNAIKLVDGHRGYTMMQLREEIDIIFFAGLRQSSAAWRERYTFRYSLRANRLLMQWMHYRADLRTRAGARCIVSKEVVSYYKSGKPKMRRVWRDARYATDETHMTHNLTIMEPHLANTKRSIKDHKAFAQMLKDNPNKSHEEISEMYSRDYLDRHYGRG